MQQVFCSAAVHGRPSIATDSINRIRVLEEAPVVAFFLEKLVVRSRLNNGAVIEYSNMCGLLYCCQSMCNNNTGPSLHETVQSILHIALGWERDAKRQHVSTYNKSNLIADLYVLEASRALVASSAMRIEGFRINARAIANRCRSPPDRFAPLSPIRTS